MYISSTVCTLFQKESAQVTGQRKPGYRSSRRIIGYTLGHSAASIKKQLLRLLKHIYSDNVKIESKYIYDLLSLADRYDIQSIKRKCEQIFAQHISVDTLCQIFKYACSFNCERLKETCLLFTEENQQDVLTSAGFEELDRDEMIQIVRVGKESKKGSKAKPGKR